MLNRLRSESKGFKRSVSRFFELGSKAFVANGTTLAFYSGGQFIRQPNPPLPIGGHPGGFSLGGQVHVNGGWNSAIQDFPPRENNLAYDGTSWTVKQPLINPARSEHRADVLGQSAYVCGGSGSFVELFSIQHADTDRFDRQTDTWTSRQSMPRSCWGHSFCRGPEREFFSIGGRIANPTPWDSIAHNQRYNPDSDSWSLRTAMPSARDSQYYGRLGLAIYVCLGEVRPSAVLQPQTFRYDVATDSWQTSIPAPLLQQGGASFVLNGKLHTVNSLTFGTTLRHQQFDGLSWNVLPNIPQFVSGAFAGGIV